MTALQDFSEEELVFKNFKCRKKVILYLLSYQNLCLFSSSDVAVQGEKK